MTFEELNEIFQKEFGATKLSDIAQEFNVTPQVVSNWKTRNQVPYKYIVSLRTKIQEQKELNVNSKTYLLDRKMQRSSDESEDDNESDDDEWYDSGPTGSICCSWRRYSDAEHHANGDAESADEHEHGHAATRHDEHGDAKFYAANATATSNSIATECASRCNDEPP